MTDLKLYSYWRSSAAYRVRIALGLKGLAYEYVPIHLVRDGGEQRTPSYRRVNPSGRVPTLEVNGHFIYQSMAILEWLEEQYPQPPLLPVAPLLRAQVRGISQMIVADIQPLQNLSVTQYLRGACALDDAKVAEWLRHWIGQGMAAVDEALQGLGGQTFSYGDTPTLADVCLVPQCYAARRFGVDPAQFSTIHRIETLCLRSPEFQRAAPEAQPDADLGS